MSNHDSGYILVYDAAGNYIDHIPMKQDIREIEISGDGKHLVANHEDGGLDLVDLASGLVHSYNLASPGVWFPRYQP